MRAGAPSAGKWFLCVVAIPTASTALEVDITGSTIEQLMNIAVTTVSRRQADLQSTPAAVHVVSRDDLRRAAVTSVPDALRLIPGVQVASIDANKWAVSIRGFNSRTANKILVLVDGRSVYDPLFGGVFWEARDVPVDEIERIEVIRGPGGTLWGTNAVNGVINIITRHSRDTDGAAVSLGTGTEDRLQSSARYGWQFGADNHARLYVARAERDTAFSSTGAHDDARLNRSGFRVDMNVPRGGELMFKGDAYDGTFGTNTALGGSQDLGHRGQNVVARWRQGGLGEAEQVVEFWYDHLQFDDVNLGEERHTYDLEYQYAFPQGDTHQITWGAGHRRTSDEIREGPILTLTPSSRRNRLSSFFAQDSINFADRSVRLIMGAKIEHNDYSGTEWQPSARLAWLIDAETTAWAAVSRAVRTPSRLEADIDAAPLLIGNPDIAAEKVVAYELGYRSRVARDAWADAAVFYNIYRDMLSLEGSRIGNSTEGETAGFEVAGRWDPHPHWRFDGSYHYLYMDLGIKAGSPGNASAAYLEDNDPHHQATLQTAWLASQPIEVHGVLRYVSRVKAQQVPSYLVADVNVGWRVHRDWELSIGARNLLDAHHPEQRSTGATEIERSVFAGVRWED